MAGKPAFQFYPGDWLKDSSLGMCEPATRGIWIDLLCAMHESPSGYRIEGTAAALARVCRCSPDEMAQAIDELDRNGVADVEVEGERYRLASRRLARKSQERAATAERVRRHRDRSDVTDDVTPDVTDQKRLCTEDEDEDEDGSKEGSPRGETRAERSAAANAVYAEYPRKVGKRKALDEIGFALDRIVAGKAGPPDGSCKGNRAAAFTFLVTVTRAFAKSPAGNRGKFTAHPATWYHQDRFDDDPDEWQDVDPDTKVDPMSYADMLRHAEKNGRRPGTDYTPVPQPGNTKPLWLPKD